MVVGIGTFLIIGVLHPIVIKVEYHWGKGMWPFFFVLGAVCCTASLFAQSLVISTLLAVLGFSLFWSIKELYEQERRVQRGWYPRKEKKQRRAAAGNRTASPDRPQK